MTKICVVGLGYIGLPTASLFATHGHEVVGVDVSAYVLETLNHGDVHIEEPGLKTVVQAALRSGNLVVRSEPEPADVFILAVPTPFKQEPDAPVQEQPGVKQADLSFVHAAANSILPHLRGGNLVVLESTSPPGTTWCVVAEAVGACGLRPGIDFHLAYCPERVLPGHILDELVRNDRIIGGINEASAERAKELYSGFVEGEILLTDAVTAEFVKLMENTYRDVNIALANEFARVAERLGIDVWEAIELANHHPRVKVLKPGPGVGGHCIAVDPWFIAEIAPEVTPLIQTARRVNDAQPPHLVGLVRELVPPRWNGGMPIVACLGLAYKADVDDVRESPALRVIELLEGEGYTVRAYDPHVRPGTLPAQVQSLEEAIADSAVILILTDHAEFRRLSPDTFPADRRAILLDTRNTLPAAPWRRAGYCLVRLGEGIRR